MPFSYNHLKSEFNHWTVVAQCMFSKENSVAENWENKAFFAAKRPLTVVLQKKGFCN